MIKQLVLKGMRWLAVAWAACLAFSCLLPESQRMPEVLELTLSEDNPSALTTSIEVQVKCDLNWTIELENKAWGAIEVKQVTEGSGGTCLLTMGVNMDQDERRNAIILKAGKGELRKTFSQQGVATFFSPTEIHLKGMQEASVSFTAPSDWTASTQEDWIALGTTSGEKGVALLKVAAKDPNENLGGREGKVSVTIDGHSIDLLVTQDQTDVILGDDTEVTMEADGGQFSVRTRYNVDYDIEISDSWITHKNTKAPLNESIETFQVAPQNASEMRTATITFSGGDAKPVVLTVQQAGLDPILTVTTQGFYGVLGVDYVMNTDGWNQSSFFGSPSGALRYRLFHPETLSVAELTGMKMLRILQEGDVVNLDFKLTKKGQNLQMQSYVGVVLRTKDDLAWIKVNDTTYFVLLAM